jgi:Uma2 family endonuclease
MSQRPEPWIVDADDPRAPPQDVWDRMTELERQRIVENLPSEFEPSEARPPEGDEHTEQVYGARTALRRFFGRTGRRIYVGTNLPLYYPGESMFSPDVMAVLDVDTHPRSSWIVSKEGKGLDLAMEVIVLGHRAKDVARNVEYYAELGIAEYFVFDRPKLKLSAFRLKPESRVYEPVVAQHGKYVSKVLDLDIVVERNRLCFYTADAALPGADELITKLEGFVDELEARLAAAERRAEEEARRAEEEARRSRLAEEQLEKALAELERLRGLRG